MNTSMAILELLVYVCIAIASIVLGITVLLKNHRAIVNRSFALFLLGIAVTMIGFILLKLQLPFKAFDKFIFYGGFITLIGLFVFSQVFPLKTHLPSRRWPLYIPFILVGILIPFNLVIRQASFSSEGKILPVNGPLFVPHMIFWIAYFLLSLLFLIRTYRETSYKSRLQLQYLFTGIIIFLTCLTVFSVILPSIGITTLYNIGPISSIAMISLTSMAIIRYQLMDIRLVIQRSLIYFALLVIIIGLYVAGLQFLGYLLHKTTDVTSIISAGIVTILGVFFMQPLRSYLEKITDPIFFRNKYVYSDAIKELSRTLNTSVTQADVIATSSKLLKSMLKTGEVHFFLDEKGQTPPPAGIASIQLPIVFEEKVIGTIELGQKRSGDSYTQQDIQLLETFLLQAAVALEKGRLYEQVQQYSAHLEQTVKERTSEIEKIQQEQKQTMIDISHNLQTPLAVIRSELEMMTDYSSDPAKMIAARRSLMRVSEFIRQLLHLARLDGSVYDIQFSPVDLSALVEEQAEYFEVMGYEHRLIVTANIEKGVTMMGNRRLIGEALTNIAQNSIKYRRKDIESTLHISLKETPSVIEITMQDNGIGIPAKDQKEIFTQFYRAARTEGQSQGAGLGLAIVTRIVEMHAGTISVASTVGTGTCFTMTFATASR